MNGILVINKAQGMTSFDVVSFLRKKTGVKRIGHSGTLDPMATGVLPIFIGNATRVIEFSGISGDPEAKIYRCGMKLGLETDTLDIWGTTLSTTSDFSIEKEEIVRVLKGFEGPGVQKPPMYSAIKIEGRKLYEYARKGIEVDESKIKEREIYIKQINVNQIDLDSNEVYFDVVCSKGVYIRTLCADIGAKLGCGAVMNSLVRLKSDSFFIEQAISLENISDSIESFPALLPLDTPLGWMPKVELDNDMARRFSLGQKIEYQEQKSEKKRVYCNGSFIGIGFVTDSGLLAPKKIIVNNGFNMEV